MLFQQDFEIVKISLLINKNIVFLFLFFILILFFYFAGNTVFVGGAASTPIPLVLAMTEHGKANCLKNVTVCHMHTEGPAPYTEPDCEGT